MCPEIDVEAVFQMLCRSSVWVEKKRELSGAAIAL